MSIDDRLREALGATDPTWDRRAPSALRAVIARRRRERLVARGAVAAAAAVATVAVIAMAGAGGNDTGPAPVGPPTETPSQEASPSPVASGSALDGHWTSAPVTAADVRAALAASNHARYADEMLAQLPPTPFRLGWVVAGAGSHLQVESNGEVTVVDEEELDVDGDRVTLSARFGPGVSVHGFRVMGNRLRLTFVTTTEGETDGVPGAAWQRLLYDTAVFRR